MLNIDAGNKLPFYEQLYRQIRERIVSGAWDFNRKLPSSRQLASDLQVSRNTVEQAYQQLCAEGYLFSKPRSGYYVERLPTAVVNTCPAPSSGGSAGEETAPDPCRYNFRYGTLDARHVPFKRWQSLLRQCLAAEQGGLVAYGGHQGERGLREQIARYVAAHRGVKCRPEQIVVGAGTLYCLELLCNLLRQPAHAIGIEDPGYGKARTVFKNSGLPVCPVSVEQDGINIRELDASGVTAVYVTPSHQFPTGGIMSITKRLQLLEWAARRQAVIIEDDYSCHFRYHLRPTPSLQGLSPAANVVYLGSFSKVLLPSLRIAFMVLPAALLERYHTVYQKYNATVPYLFQKTLEQFMKEGYFDRHLSRILQVYRQKHDCLIGALNKEFGDRICITGSHAGLFITIEVPGALSEAQLIERAAAWSVRVYPVAEHWERGEQYGGRTVLLGYSSLTQEEIRAAVSLLRKAWLDVI